MSMRAANFTGKRKRPDASRTVQFKKAATQAAVKKSAEKPTSTATPKTKSTPDATQALNGTKETGGPAKEIQHDLHIQIVTGSYERVLHGICASIPSASLTPPREQDGEQNGTAAASVTFSDTFLFAAHASSIRCLTISPPTSSNKRTLATGGSDERINLYSISTMPPASKPASTKLPSLSSSSTSENASNRSLGTLLHHDRAITALAFPSKSKLFSAAEDNTIAISRTRDWTMLSSIRAPIPKAQGRPSGDTAGPGEVPAGVNDFAVHPSQKLMLSVGRGEKCMRLWNLITGKKAGVLSFEREVLAQVGEGRFSAGEGRKVCWDEKGEVYVVGFERGAVVFGIDSKPKALVKADRPTKFHQMRFLPAAAGFGEGVLAVSTEDGKVLFFDLSSCPEEADSAKLPQCPCIAQLGGRAAGIAGRIKDFEILQPPAPAPGAKISLLAVTASSDGAIRIWNLATGELKGSESGKASAEQVGHLVGTLETSNRITSLGAFVMDGKTVDGADGAVAVEAADEDEVGSASADEDDEEESD